MTVVVDEKIMQAVRDGKPPKIGIFIDGVWHYWFYRGPREVDTIEQDCKLSKN